jgi:hypothetical protein
VESSGTAVTTDTQIINFTGSAVSVTTGDTANEAVVNITGGGGGGGVYIIKLEYNGGSLISPDPFVAAVDPDGNNILNVNGWNMTRVSGTAITISHPLDNWVVDIMTHARIEGATEKYYSKHVMGLSSNQIHAVQYPSKAKLDINAMDDTSTGIGYGSQYYLYLTFALPTNNIFI